ncbi:PP2C family protein-serine/threonine phosphatase [Amycolatopsis sp. NBC_00438]|uniref:PP2C family protein-serine/threonine phosphatase n=1 Tax=Amycolatopsis sp. NBC_00438 TaxID=2903558 RepID=UPI002E20AD79
MIPLPEQEQQELLTACFRRCELTLEQLWARYFALGGGQNMLEVDAYLHGLAPLPRIDRDMLAHAVNERLDELSGPKRAPYSHPTQPAKPLRGPLRALVDLLEGTHRAPPERLPAAVTAAADALNLRVEVHLADYDQNVLVPLLPATSPGLDIETTTAGEVFRSASSAVARDAGVPVLWTVLLDGVERLGVLEVTSTDGTDPDDPVLRQQCQWLATLIGHLVTSVTQYGDGLDVQRRRHHRGSPSELLWHALPPLTGATDAVVVGASMRPAYELSGTAFDYSLSEHRAQLALFDTGARGGAPSLAVVTALSAYRSARRDGASLAAQHAAIAGILGEHPDTPAVNELVAELDLHTGDLRWLAAGSRAPVIVHRGGSPGPRAGQETGQVRLRPGDLFAACCRGTLETRNPSGAPFGAEGVQRAVDRHADSPAPEIARKITEAVADHHGSALPDDVGVVVVRWTPIA